MRSIILLPLAAALLSTAWGQKLDLSSLDKLSGRAKESSTVNLDGDKLQTALGFLTQASANKKAGKDKEMGLASSLVSGLKGVYVRTFEFDKPGSFTQTDLESLRRQLRGPGWSKVIEVKERDESSEIYFFKSGEGAGMAVIAAEKSELSVVNLVGPVDLSALGKIGDIMNLPSIQSSFGEALAGGKTGAPGAKDDDDDDDQ